MTEIWKDVKGFVGYYAVSNIGRIKSFDRRVRVGKGHTRIARGKILSGRDNSSGYKFVTLYDATTQRSISRYIHALVAEAFLGFICGAGMTVDHIDNNKGNNDVRNLRLLSQSDNSKRWRQKIKGFDTTKLTVDQVRRLRYFYGVGIGTQRQFARSYGVSNRAIQKCIARETWKNVI